MTVSRLPTRQLILAGATGLALVACGHHASGGSQVAVKVNKDEITVLQLNQQMARLPASLPQSQRDEATRRAIAGLVDQQLLVQQAIDHKLDRDPEVVSALEAARQQLLAQAYVQRVLGAQAKPTEQEVKQYYAENPSLFAERKVYQLQELTIHGTPEQIRSLEEHEKGTRSLRELAVWLKDNKIEFNVEAAVRSAEQLPMDRLSQVARLKEGEVAFFRVAANPNHVTALQVLGSQMQPVDDKQAAPVIEQFLTNRKRGELTQSEVKRLREAAKIEYVGDFSKFATASAAPEAAPAQAAAAGPVPDAMAAPGPTAATADTSKVSNDKGIAGLR